MLHRTHHRSFFHFNPFSSRSSLETPSPPSLQGKEAEMDCVDRALRKSSLRPEESLKATQAAAPEEFCDDLWTSTVQSGVSADEFFVDDLLDFSHGGMEEQLQEEEKEDDKSGAGASVSPHMESTGNSNSTPKDDFASLPASELSVPAEDLADLEWLSHFVEDSFSLTYTPAGNLSQKPEEGTENRSEPESPKPCFTTPVPAKSRSKRARPGARSWSTSAAGDSSSTSSTSSTSSSPSSPWLIYAVNNSNAAESLNPGAEKPPAPKKQRRKPVNRISDDGAQATAPAAPRRCSHCGVQKTPQWRTGPLGAKTLCNACGVRFKSGRLLPEYRPACSPTFSSDLHSNSHRKVLEMRRKKEVVAPPEPGLAVQSF